MLCFSPNPRSSRGRVLHETPQLAGVGYHRVGDSGSVHQPPPQWYPPTPGPVPRDFPTQTCRGDPGHATTPSRPQPRTTPPHHTFGRGRDGAGRTGITYGTPHRYPGCVLFKSAALSLRGLRVPWLLRLWESKPLFTILLAPEASTFRVFWMFPNPGFKNSGLCSRGSSKFMELVENVDETNIFHDLSGENHGKCWFYQHVQQFP